MNFWHMQLHPNNINWQHEKKLLKDKKIIGLGDWKELKNQQYQFEEVMAKGDIVLIKRGGTIIALVEVIGDYEYSDDTDDLIWFQRRRKVRILDWYQNSYRYNVAVRGTLTRCNRWNRIAPTNKSIMKWYKKIQ